MEDTDVALNDEGQQYGNLDEASAIARAPRKCLVIWCGDHKQTPGGLRKTDEAKAFRRKLLRRPIALRGDTKHFQPNMLGKVVLRYLEGMDEPLINSIQAILRATMGGMSVASAEGIATLQSLCQEVGCPYHDELLRHLLCCTCSALDGLASREVSPVGDLIASCCLFFLARCCLGQVPGGAPFSQRSEQATACTNRMQIRN